MLDVEVRSVVKYMVHLYRSVIPSHHMPHDDMPHDMPHGICLMTCLLAGTNGIVWDNTNEMFATKYIITSLR